MKMYLKSLRAIFIACKKRQTWISLATILLLISGYSNAQNFVKVTTSAIPALTNAKSQWIDINNDELLDLFITGVMGNGTYHTAIYTSNGNNTYNTISLNPLVDVVFDLGDYNNDGYIDIILSGNNASAEKKTYIYKNNSGTSFTAQSFSITPLTNGSIIWNDLDNDADLDILMTGLNSLDEETTLLYEYKNNTYESIAHTLPLLSNGQIKSFDADNDGFTEVLLTGLNSNGTSVSNIYTVHPDLSFSLYSGSMDGSAFNSIATGDYDQDGFLDLVVSGLSSDLSASNSALLQNNTTNGFSSISTALQPVSFPSADFGDLNNDGLNDLIVTGIDDASFKYFKYYRNNAGSSFTDVTHSMKNIYSGDVSLGDYDNDGDLDIFQIGNSDVGFEVNLYDSDQSATVTNNAPVSPSGLSATITEDSVYFGWTKATDDHTATNSVTYNLYVSQNSNGTDLFLSPLSTISNGFRKIPKDGNTGSRNSKSIRKLPEGRYYWSVQAIDNSFKASTFAPEQTFAICYPISLGSDTTICYDDDLELSIGSPSDVVNWYSKSNGLITATSNSFSYEIIANDTIIVELTKPYGCTVYDTLLVNVSIPPAINLGSDIAICSGQEFTPQISVPVDSANWYHPAGLLVANADQYTYIVSVKDTIIAEAFNQYECVSYDSIIVDVLSLPQFNVGSDTAICYKQDVLFELPNTWTEVNWLSGNQILATDTSRYLLNVLTNKSIVAEVTDGNNCTNYDTLYVSVLALPPVNLGADPGICYKEDATLQLPNNGNTINWYTPGNQLLLSNNNTYIFSVLMPTDIVAEAIDANACVNYDTVHVNVLPLPSFTVGADTALCFKKKLLLKIGAGFDEVNWYSKKKGISLLNDSWFFDYQVVETDTLIAEVFSTQQCVNYDSIIIAMNPLPAFSLGVDLNKCQGDSVKLNLGGGWSQVNWYTGEDILLAQNNPEIKLKSEATITIRAEVFNAPGCVNFDTLKINALPLPVFSLGNDKTYCFGDSVKFSFNAPGATVYSWKSNNTVLSSIRDYRFKAASTSTISLTAATNDLCSFTDVILISVNALPSFTIDGGREVCEKDTANLSVTYSALKSITWLKNNIALPGNASALNIYMDDTADISALLTDTNGCRSSNTIQLVVNKRPAPDAGEDKLLCFGESTPIGKIYNNSNLNIQWSPIQFLSNAQIGNPTASPTTTTTYVVKITDNKNCTAYDSVYLEVNPKILIDAGSNSSICIGDSIKLGGSPTASGSRFGYTYQWMAGAASLSDITPNPIVFPTQTTRYFVLVSSGNCQIELDSIDVIVNSLPKIDIISDQSIGAGESVSLYTTGGVSYSWAPKESLDNYLTATPVASPLRTTTYMATVTDQNGCSDKAQVDVLVQNQLFIPNLFTPNGDGKNDVFLLYGSGIKNITLSIFDQTGKRLYYTESLEDAFGTGWDGTYNGKPLKNDIYFWTIDGEFYNEEAITFEGKRNGIIKLVR